MYFLGLCLKNAHAKLHLGSNKPFLSNSFPLPLLDSPSSSSLAEFLLWCSSASKRCFLLCESELFPEEFVQSFLSAACRCQRMEEARLVRGYNVARRLVELYGRERFLYNSGSANLHANLLLQAAACLCARGLHYLSTSHDNALDQASDIYEDLIHQTGFVQPARSFNHFPSSIVNAARVSSRRRRCIGFTVVIV
jgi:hypothetical protein